MVLDQVHCASLAASLADAPWLASLSLPWGPPHRLYQTPLAAVAATVLRMALHHGLEGEGALPHRSQQLAAVAAGEVAITPQASQMQRTAVEEVRIQARHHGWRNTLVEALVLAHDSLAAIRQQ